MKKLVLLLMLVVGHADASQLISGQSLTSSAINASIATANITAGSVNGSPIGTITPSTGTFTTLTHGSALTSAAARVVNIGTTADTLAAGIATTWESANTASGAFTVTIAAPTADGEMRRICFANATGTITWTVTAPATATVGLPATMAAGQCVGIIYNAVAAIPANSAATTWYQY